MLTRWSESRNVNVKFSRILIAIRKLGRNINPQSRWKKISTVSWARQILRFNESPEAPCRRSDLHLCRIQLRTASLDFVAFGSRFPLPQLSSFPLLLLPSFPVHWRKKIPFFFHLNIRSALASLAPPLTSTPWVISCAPHSPTRNDINDLCKITVAVLWHRGPKGLGSQ